MAHRGGSLAFRAEGSRLKVVIPFFTGRRYASNDGQCDVDEVCRHEKGGGLYITRTSGAEETTFVEAGEMF